MIYLNGVKRRRTNEDFEIGFIGDEEGEEVWRKIGDFVAFNCLDCFDRINLG